MPVSKKPRSKTVAKATAKAQDVMYDAWERTTSRSRIALAHKSTRHLAALC
jgi:hypothetical protein